MPNLNPNNLHSDPAQSKIKKNILDRVYVLYVIFAAIAILIFGMIIVTQYGPNGTPLRNRSDLKCFKTMEVTASRGTIYSHDELILATDSPSYNISIDFTVLDLSNEQFEQQSAALADSLSRTIPGYTKEYFVRRLKEIYTRAKAGGPGSQSQRLIRDKVNQLQLDRIKTFPIFNKGRLGGGLIYTKDSERYKPFGTLAARTIGKPGEFGLESSFNDVLSGHNGQNRCVRLYSDIWVPVVSGENVEARNGQDLITTIDVSIQDIVETELRRQILENSATCGTAVVMEVNTGEIRAISNLTRYGSMVRDDVNHALTMRCEPGSTFKLVSLMALIEEAGYSLDYPVDCSETGNYTYTVGNRKYLVQDSHKVGQTDLLGALEQSSNIGFVKLIDAEYHEKPERFVDFIHSLGIDRSIDMQLTGGLKPVIKDPRRKKETAWDALSLMKMSYGYAVEVTPMHTLMLYNAVANGGRMVAPRLVNEIREDGKTVQEFKTEVVNNKICSEKTLKLVRRALEGVVEEGTGSMMRNPNFKIAGKTGTAQVAMKNSGYVDSNGGRDYLATFVGYFPADNPKYTCIVAIKTYYGPGSRHAYYGASLAAPAFKAIANRIYALDINAKPTAYDEDVAPNAAVKGGNVQQIRTATSQLDIHTSLHRRDRGWGTAHTDSTFVNVEMLQNSDEMPSVVGMSLKDALYVLESKGLKVSFAGKGKVTSQSIKAGTPITTGSSVYLTLRPADKHI